MTETNERDRIETDLLIVGAGPAGLCAAIRAKQLAAKNGQELGVTIIEKSAELGGHILSGAVLDAVALDALLPRWRETSGIGMAPVTSEHMHFLTRNGDFTVPHWMIPPPMKTTGGLILSLGDLCRWLGSEAEALGVEIYPATAGTELLIGDEGGVEGVVTGDLGRDRDGHPREGFAAGIALGARFTLLAEGARGSLTKDAVRRFDLDKGSDPQLYGLGIKEIWQIDPARHRPGRVDHYLGWPLDDRTSGGGFAYHAAGGKLYLGHITHLNYTDPTLSPFDEFQRFKMHGSVAGLLEGAERIAYGARALTSGGLQSVPELAFPGGALIGCGAGFMNVPRIKGIHNAMRSGIATAEAVLDAFSHPDGRPESVAIRRKVFASGIGAELHRVRNMKPLWSRAGTVLGAIAGGADMWVQSLFRISALGTLRHRAPDFAKLKKRRDVDGRTYDKTPKGPTQFDRASSVYLANIVHDEDQPNHLILADQSVPLEQNLPEYGEPAPLYCPAGVYELAEVEGQTVFRINSANCVHCKTCDIKDPSQNIIWVPPEGGSGPNYRGM